jgi:dipeptidyl aminopeptidase/acylaminoacyl peptidase
VIYEQQAQTCPNLATNFLVIQGKDDVQVPIASSIELINVMRKWKMEVNLKEVSTVAHGFDYDIPLSDAAMESFRRLMEDIGM